MITDPQEDLLKYFQKFGRLFLRQVISDQEYVNNALDRFASEERVHIEIVPQIWELVPDAARDLFIQSMRLAVKPEFRWHPFYIGGRRIQTEEELRLSAELNTNRIRAWALAFVQLCDGTVATNL